MKVTTSLPHMLCISFQFPTEAVHFRKLGSGGKERGRRWGEERTMDLDQDFFMFDESCNKLQPNSTINKLFIDIPGPSLVVDRGVQEAFL